MKGEQPNNLEPVDPSARVFPASWRDAAIRAAFDDACGGVVCPQCRKVFGTRRELRELHADHQRPWSRGGLTTWENLQLLCGPCNLMKNNRFEGGIE